MEREDQEEKRLSATSCDSFSSTFSSWKKEEKEGEKKIICKIEQV